ncbi:MAG: hypothetical protein JKX69_09075 [Rhodobacteraceae bacterium]|nr:hypothetical protein [Paracoccaceae bacterium]
MKFSYLRFAPLIPAFCLGLGTSAFAQDRDIVVVVGNEPTTVDPCDLEAAPALVLAGNVVQTLTDINPITSDVEPLLAASWEQDGDMAWIFTLNEGITFSDGAVFDAEAAAWGINRAMNTPEITCSDQAKVAEEVSVSVIGPMTIRLETNIPAPALPRELAYLHLSSPLSTPATEKTAMPVGTGAYTFDEWTPGQSITLSLRDDYWGETPAVENVTILFRAEPSVRAQMVETGEADMAYPIPPQFATDDDRTKQFPISSVFFIRLSNTIAPLDDIRVRQALRMAIDKTTGVEVLLNRTGVPTDNAVASSINAFIPDYAESGFDLEGARALLAEAAADGVPVDTEIEFVAMINQFTGSAELQQYITQNLQDAGFNINLQIVDGASWAEVLFTRSTPTDRPVILASKNGNTTGDGSPTFTSYADMNGCCASSQDPVLAGLIDAARQQADPEARRDAWHEAATYLYTTDLSIVPVAELRGLMLLSDRIDYEPNGQTEDMQLKLQEISFR